MTDCIFCKLASGEIPTSAVSGNENAQEEQNGSDEELLKALARERSLTGRELDVLREYVSGKSRTEIGEALFISESTVKNHISNIFSKLGVKSKKELLELISGRASGEK